MLSNVSLENYKSFKDNSSIEFKPLTILCGINSSGKSSIIKSLLTIKQTIESTNENFSLLLSGNLVNNGTFRDIVSENNCRNNIKIKNTFVLTNSNKYKTGFSRLCRFYGFKLSDVNNFEITFGIVLKSKLIPENIFNEFLDNNRLTDYYILIKPHLNNEEADIEAFEMDLSKKQDEEMYNLVWKNLPKTKKNETLKTSRSKLVCRCSFSGLSIISIGVVEDATTAPTLFALPKIMEVSHIITNEYKKMYFIAPLRENPKRTYDLDHYATSVGNSGENTPIILASLYNKQVPYNVSYFNKGNIKIKYDELLNYWLRRFDIPELNLKNNKGSISLNIGRNNITDVGFGVSQVLPIITQSLLMDKDDTLLIEQPEIHLHPKMALEMADFLIEQVKNERNMIVETHSDHIVNRIIRRVMEDYQKLNDKVRIYFVYKDENNQSICSPVTINEFDGCLNEYEDFFTQYYTEIQKTMEISLKKFDREEK